MLHDIGFIFAYLTNLIFYAAFQRTKHLRIYKKNLILPTDISGLVYKEVDHSIAEVEYALTKELKEVGYNLKL